MVCFTGADSTQTPFSNLIIGKRPTADGDKVTAKMDINYYKDCTTHQINQLEQVCINWSMDDNVIEWTYFIRKSVDPSTSSDDRPIILFTASLKDNPTNCVTCNSCKRKKVRATCSAGQIQELSIGEDMTHCGIEGMLTYLCMEDPDVVKSIAGLYTVKGYGWFDEFQMDISDLEIIDPVNKNLDSHDCTTRFYINSDMSDIKSDTRIHLAEPNALISVLNAAVNAHYRFVFLLDGLGTTENEVNIYGVRNKLEELKRDSKIFHQFENKKMLFCKQHSRKDLKDLRLEKDLKFDSSNKRYKFEISNKRTKEKCQQSTPYGTYWGMRRTRNEKTVKRKPEDIARQQLVQYYIKRMDIDVPSGSKMISQDECEGTAITKKDSDGYIACKKGIEPEIIVKPDFQNCGIESVLEYFCLTDDQVSGEGQGYNLESDVSTFVTEPQKALKTRLLTCDKLYYPARLFQNRQIHVIGDNEKNPDKKGVFDYVLERLIAILDSGYEKVALICTKKTCKNKKQFEELEKIHYVESIIISMMTEKNVPRENKLFPWLGGIPWFRGIGAYFCKNEGTRSPLMEID